MGYYSEVAIAIKSEEYYNYFDGVQQLENLMGLANIQESKIYNIVVIYFNSIKWYPDFKDIQLVENILSHIAFEEKPYAFVRIGEEYGDIETRTYEGKEEEYLDEFIYPVNYISTPSEESFVTIGK